MNAQTTTTTEPAEDWSVTIGKSAYASIVEMVAALDCDYDRLEELREELTDAHESDTGDLPNCCSPIGEWLAYVREHADHESHEAACELAELESEAGDCKDREEAEQRIMEDPLSLELRGDWYSYGADPEEIAEPVEFKLLLGTGGPAVQIIGELRNREVYSARLMVQDWFKPWTEYMDADHSVLESYCRCFCFE